MIDLTLLRKLMSNDEKRVQQFLDIFSVQVPDQMQALKSALADRDLEEVSTIAHSIKSQVRYFNAHTVADLAYKVERAAEKGLISGQLRTDVNALETHLKSLLEDPVFEEL